MTPTEKALIAEFEAVLQREGLGVLDERELRHPGHVRGGTQGRSAQPFEVQAKAEFWRRVRQGVADLPRNYPLRGFLSRVAETGNLLASCREHGITRKAGRWAFRTLLHSIGLGSSRPARFAQRAG